MTKTVVALYKDVATARRVVEALINRGFRREDISFTVSDENNQYSSYLRTEHGGEEKTSAVAGGAGVGAVLGGLGGLLVGIGALAIPGLGPIVAAGPLASALVGAGIGAVAGGLVGALVDIGVPEDEAELYTEGVRRGNTLVALAVPDNRVSEVTDVLQSFSPIDVRQSSADWGVDGMGTGTEYAGTTGTGTMGAGTGYSATGSSRGEWGSEGVGGRQEAGTASSDTASTAMRSSRTGFESQESLFRRHYMDTYRERGHDFNYYSPAYRYGYSLADDPRYNNRDWTDIESDARHTWRTWNSGPWDDVKDAVRYAWEQAKAGARDLKNDIQDSTR